MALLTSPQKDGVDGRTDHYPHAKLRAKRVIMMQPRSAIPGPV
jgi:hypothetical protein